MDTALEITQRELMYVALIGAGIGLILGLVPLVLAIRKGRVKLGLLAALLSTVAGCLGTIYYGGIILSLIIDAIFVWLLLKKGSATMSENPSDSTPS